MREYTARELAEVLLAMPDPDSVVGIRVMSWTGRELTDQHLMRMTVHQGIGDDFVGRDPDAHWVEIVAETEPRAWDLMRR